MYYSHSVSIKSSTLIRCSTGNVVDSDNAKIDIIFRSCKLFEIILLISAPKVVSQGLRKAILYSFLV